MFVDTGAFFQIAERIIRGPLWQIIQNWWWMPLPFILKGPFLYLWEWWRNGVWLEEVYDPRILEIKIPREITKPISAMEVVMNSIHSVLYHAPDPWERWIEGQLYPSTSAGLEIACIDGKIHFYLRVHEGYRDAVEASIYSHYPEVEITEVDDYTKGVPQDIPNKEWDLWGSDYVLLKNEAYPILTYKDFEREEETEEERKVDPVANLMEALGRVGPDEQFWIQIVATPVTEEEYDWIGKAKELRDELAKRPAKTRKSYKPMAVEAANILLTGKVPEEEEEKEEKEAVIPPEMRMTPGEREIVEAIERKISKPGFLTHIRFIYMGKRDVFLKAKLRLAFAFFGSYYTHNLNALIPFGKTLTKIHRSWFLPLNLFRPRRMYLRQRKLFRNYLVRLPSDPPFFKPEASYILNTEELASLFHFPSWRVAPVPSISRIEAKKKPPSELPNE